MTSKKMSAAQAAFATRDSDLSRAVHQSTELAEIATGKSDFLHGIPPSSSLTASPLNSAIVGALSCTILAAAMGVTIIGIGVWSMAVVAITCILFFSSWIDERFRSDFHDFEQKREKWEVDNFPEGEIQEMLHIYTTYGVSEKDATVVAETLSKYPEFWVDHMLLHEIGILPSHMIKRHEATNLLSIGAFLVSFVLPSMAVYCTRYTTAGAFWIGFSEVCVLLHYKNKENQWLSKTTVASIALVLIITCCSVHFSLRFFLSLAT